VPTLNTSESTFPSIRAQRIILALLLLVCAVLAIMSLAQKGATWDETLYITAGYSYLTTGRIEYYPGHPPLLKYLAAFPMLFMDVARPDADFWETRMPEREVAEFLYQNDLETILFWARFPTVALTLLLVWLVFRWARELFGPTAGLLAAGLCALSPNILAHGRLATSDMGFTLFFFATFYWAWKFCAKPSRANMLLMALACALTQVCKVSGVFLFPMLAVLFGAAYVRSRRNPEEGRPLCPFRLTSGFVYCIAVSAVVLWATYLFQDLDNYFLGFERVAKMPERGFPAFLREEFSFDGWRHYFIYAIAIKTPIAALVLGLASAISMRRIRGPRLGDLFLLLPALSYLAIISAKAPNIGLRYILPLYPLLFVFASRVAKPDFLSKKWRTVAVGMMLVLYCVESGSIYPHYLAYYNAFVGGPKNAVQHLSDSNLDWGQDITLLAEYAEEQSDAKLYLLYFGTEIPERRGIQYRMLPPGEPFSNIDPGLEPKRILVALSATHLQGTFMVNHVTYWWLHKIEPIERLGHTIYVYDLTDMPKQLEILANIYDRFQVTEEAEWIREWAAGKNKE